MNSENHPMRPQNKRIALVLQGGGALGAYQVGVYQALQEHGFTPDWIAGTSIGAINGAIIAGNSRENCLARLEEFWRTVARQDFFSPEKLPEPARQAYGFWSAMASVWLGQPGFFTPRPIPPFTATPSSSPEGASYYDTAPLRELLGRLVDFDLLNNNGIRFSMGVVHVKTGRLRYFDSRFDRIGAQHVMASGALPPGFPAVAIDNELYWDGGVYSNTPLEVVLDDHPRRDTLCFMVDLFNAAGPAPLSIPEVLTRQKDIQYATRSREHIDTYQKIHNLRRAVRELHAKLDVALHDDPEVKSLAALGCHTTMQIVHLTYPEPKWEISSKDADFSWSAIEERWQRGYADAMRALNQAPWEQPTPPHAGVVVYEIPPET